MKVCSIFSQVLKLFSRAEFEKVLAIIRKRLFLDSGRAVRPEPAAAPGPKHAEWIDPSALGAADGALWRAGRSNDSRHSEWSRSLIRHARPTTPLAVGSLAEAVSVLARS